MTALLDVQNLSLEFRSGGRPPIPALQDVSFTLDRGETLAVLGESGSGKSITAKAIMGILPKPASRVTGGRIMFDGEDLLTLPPARLRKVQGARIAMIFQDALSALNPVQTVSTQIAELYRVHRGMPKRQAIAAAIDMMRAVRIPDAANRANDYPFQFSGGMRQRIMIAMALALDPDVLIADEPTTALDATVQAQILELLSEITQERRMALLMITHDLGVAGQLADRALVMYAGRVAESGPIGTMFDRPAHPYTRGLLGSIPSAAHRGADLPTIPGLPPDIALRPPGCSFNPRCEFATDECRSVLPLLEPFAAQRAAACHHKEEVLADAPVGA
ncbi:ABC transporter ATP-binding protein [Microbacterium esteraromaticum]|uniref:ABC transporter ATP-binding protein n=1 Tax=Microbacterium esteraromaticum TaxID=57043 RepID=UPI0019587D7D|nr:ABC transporter ATP-binding protein [Microbacterium esteraromaticum]MBM7464796.1 oligopeptide transport system ATP-binding protein [Microbacterium esteraromaticum]